MAVKNISKEELTSLLDKEEVRRRREAKRRNEEIITLMTQEETEMSLEYQGKLWGENSISGMAEQAYGGDGEKWSTDTEAFVCADIDPIAYGVDPDVIAQPIRHAMLVEAWDLTTETIGGQWGESGLRLFSDWLQMPVAELCRENDVPAIQTLNLIKAMVKALRKEVWENGRSKIFPFPEEEAEIRALAKNINKARAYERYIAGIAQSADPESRYYLTPAEKDMSLDSLHQYLLAKGFKLHRSGAYRAKKTGWVHKAEYRRSQSVGKKITLTDKQRQLPIWRLVEIFAIADSTALNAKKRGFFMVNNQNKDRAKTFSAQEISPEQEIILPEVLKEVAGKKIFEMTVKELRSLGVKSKEKKIIARGSMIIKQRGREFQKRLAARIQELERDGWPTN